MPLLEINQTRQVSASIRLNETTATLIDQYASFIHASADHVVDTALNYIFAKDREFQEFLKTPHSAAITPTLRVRKGPNAEPMENLNSSRKPPGVEVVRLQSGQKA